MISVIVPAHDEARALPATLDQLRRCAAVAGAPVELIVVDNASSDATARVARAQGAHVVSQPERRGIGAARNAGAAAACGDVLVFVDADVTVPDAALARVMEAMDSGDCLGGAFDTHYRPRRRLMRVYLDFWRLVGGTFRMAQGAFQFCRWDVFETLHGYAEGPWMGEDVEFWWRLRRLARRRGGRVEHVRDLRVVPSSRRYDQWPIWRTLLWTNPLFVTLFARSRRAWWGGWYESPPR